jgi:hypothetical protein
MNRVLTRVLFLSLCAAPLAAQGMPFVFTTSQTEQTMSGSGGTVLNTIRPNEVAMIEFFPCPVISAEKWTPRTCFNTMAGDDNGDAWKSNPTMFGRIDALLEIHSPVALSNQRTVFWSPSVAMQVGVSGAPGLRPGDTGRIVRNGSGDGQVEYFLRLEQVVQALGMPIGSIVDVDAIAADPAYGVFLSLDVDTPVNMGCSTTFVRDGDVIMIPASAITWTWDLRVQSVLPGSGLVLYTEAQMSGFVANAQVTDRFGVCQNTIQDLEALDIDYFGAVQSLWVCSSTLVTVPALAFTGELMTGCSVLTTDLGGSILQRGCGGLGAPCGTGPTWGFQMGLQPSGGQGVASYVNALATAFPRQYTLEPKQHQFAWGNPAVLDLYSPGVLTVVFARFESPLPNTVATSAPFPPSIHFPDEYITGNFFWSFTGNGYTTYTSPVIPWPCKLVWQSACITSWSTIELSTPAMTDVF